MASRASSKSTANRSLSVSSDGDRPSVERELDTEELRLRRLVEVLEGGGFVEHTGNDEHLVPLEDRTMDGGTELAERTLQLGVLESIEEKLAEVRAARDRLARGVYGRCEQCGAMISPERLQALPLVRECANHPMTTHHSIEPTRNH